MAFLDEQKRVRRLAAAALLLGALPAAAHHSRAIYDEDQTITLEGVVSEFEWANPHVYLHVETRSESGEPVVWAIEHGSTTAMKKRGWSPDTFVPGDEVIVQAHPGRNSMRNVALVYSVEKAGVTRLGRGDPDEALTAIQGPPIEADGLSGTWVILQTLMVRYFSEPYEWPLTERGRGYQLFRWWGIGTRYVACRLSARGYQLFRWWGIGAYLAPDDDVVTVYHLVGYYKTRTIWRYRR